MATRRAAAAQDGPNVAEQQEAAELDAAAIEGVSSDIREAATKRRAARVGAPDWQRQNLIDGYLAERRGFVSRGNEDAVALVDAELERLGHKGGDE